MRTTAVTLFTAALLLAGAQPAAAQAPPVCDAYTGVCPATPTPVAGVISTIPPVDESTEVTPVVGGVTEDNPGAEAENQPPTVVRGVQVTTPAVGGTTLPVTGAELTGLVLAGLVLLGGGAMLVVASRRRKHQPTA